MFIFVDVQFINLYKHNSGSIFILLMKFQVFCYKYLKFVNNYYAKLIKIIIIINTYYTLNLLLKTVQSSIQFTENTQ